MSENKNTFTTREESTSPIQAILVGVVTKDDDAAEVEIGLDELARLLDTAGGEVFARVVQNKSTPDPRTLIGSGKVQELADLCRNHSIVWWSSTATSPPSRSATWRTISAGATVKWSFA